MSYIEVVNYSKVLKGHKVLDAISLNIEKGTVIGLHGRNASGKTMLLRALAGLILPTEGYVCIDGRKLEGKNRFPKSCGIIIETMGFWPNLNGQDTLEILTSVKETADKETIRNTLQRVGLNPEDKRKVRKYSLGMKQKLAIAQAVIEQPDLLLLDEPTNSLDEEARENFTKIIEEETTRGCTVIMASHIIEDLAVCDVVYEIRDGKIIHAED